MLVKVKGIEKFSLVTYPWPVTLLPDGIFPISSVTIIKEN